MSMQYKLLSLGSRLPRVRTLHYALAAVLLSIAMGRHIEAKHGDTSITVKASETCAPQDGQVDDSVVAVPLSS